MRTVKYLGLTMLAATALAAVATIASAQDRDAAMQKCLQQARANFPGSGPDDVQDANRSAFYKACMTREGFTP
jgi:hypothetical protein